MNEIDIFNIQEILKSRYNPMFKEGGDLEINALEKLSTSDLEDMMKNFKSEKFKKDSDEFKFIIKSLFDKYGKPKDSIIILSECYRYEYEWGEPVYVEDYTEFSPLKIETGDNNWAQKVDLGDTEEIHKQDERLCELVGFLNIPLAEDFFEDDPGINYYWHGFIAVNRNFEIISFICRDDNLMSDKNKDKPNIIMKL